MSIAVLVRIVRICAARQRRVGRLHERRDRRGVRRGRRRAEERARESADAGDRHAVGRGDVRLLQHLAAGRRHVARRDRRAVGLIEDVPRAVGAERLDDFAGGERLRKRRAGRRRRDAERAGPVPSSGRASCRRWQSTGGRGSCSGAGSVGCGAAFFTITMRGFADALARSARSDPACRSGCWSSGRDRRARGVEPEQIVVVRRPPSGSDQYRVIGAPVFAAVSRLKFCPPKLCTRPPARQRRAGRRRRRRNRLPTRRRCRRRGCPSCRPTRSTARRRP